LDRTSACSPTRRGQVDQSTSGADQRCNPVHEDEVAQVIGAELRLEVVRGIGKRCGHDARVGDDHIEGFTLLSSPSAQAGTLFRLARSSATSSKLPPLASASFRSCAVAASAFFKSRAAPTTWAPCAASERAVSTPSPAETPVTKIRLPRRLIPDKTSSAVEVSSIRPPLCSSLSWSVISERQEICGVVSEMQLLSRQQFHRPQRA